MRHCTVCGNEIKGSANLIAGDESRPFCNRCFMDRMDDEPDFEEFDDESSEPIGSCDECESDIYEDDVYFYRGLRLCGQCLWAAKGGPG